MSQEYYRSAVVKAIKALKDRRGSTMTEIENYIKANPVHAGQQPSNWNEAKCKKALKDMEKEGNIEKKGSRYAVGEGFKLPSPNQMPGKMIDMWRNEQLCDAEIVSSDGQSFKVHRLVLASSSDYMNALLAEDRFKDSADCPINLPDVPADMVRAILNWMYGCEYKVRNTAMAICLLEAASWLQCKALIDQVEDKLCNLISAEYCVDLWALGDRLSRTRLAKKAEEVARASFDDLAKSDSFVDIEFDRLLSLVKANQLQVSKEQEVYEAVLKWAKANTEKGSCNIAEVEQLFACVRIPHIDKEFLSKHAVHESFFVENPMIFQVLFRNAVNSTLSKRGSFRKLKKEDVKRNMEVFIIEDADVLNSLWGDDGGSEWVDGMADLPGTVRKVIHWDQFGVDVENSMGNWFIPYGAVLSVV